MDRQDQIRHNVELIKRHFRNEELGDSPAVLAEMTQDCHYYMRPVIDRRIDSVEEIAGIHNTLISAFSGMYIRIEEIVASEDFGAAQVVLGGKHTGEWDGLAPTGKDVQLHTCAFFKFRDGKIVSESIYFDRREILRQLGIRESLLAE